MRLVRRTGQVLLSAIFLSGGFEAARNPGPRATKADTTGLPALLGTDAATLVRANGVAMVAGGLALAADVLPRLAAAGLAASLVPTTLAGHRFWAETDPKAKANQRIHFLKNASLVGGCLVLASTRG